MPENFAKLEIRQAGNASIVSFGGREVLEQVNLAACREQIEGFVRQSNSQTLAFDLTGVRLIPSGLLGLITGLRDLGVNVQVFNPSDDVREVLEVTKLNQLLEVREGRP